ncbi:MAG: Na/Pi cotransporter family protein [Aeoliella sp.]
MNTEELMRLLFGIVGGLGIFLLGMKNMSEGMQAVAGGGLRRMIAAVTNNRLMATGVGVLVTCIVQSSSVTTVMVIGFVNSSVMTLTQAIGVILGANIGTTITGWVLVLKVGKYGLPLLGAAAIIYLFSRRDRWRYWAMFFMGVGMVFFGLEIMKDACSIIKEIPAFEDWFQKFRADSYTGVLKCALAGCILTLIVQSSSATLAITIALVSQGNIPFETGAALVLGENIGTTITAYLASLGATTNARRAAYFHVIFNLIGVFWITLLFDPYIDIVQQVVGGDPTRVEMKVIDGKQVETYPETTALIAGTHTIFNVVNTILFLPFLGFLATMLERLVPGKAFKEKPKLTDLDVRMLDTPALGVEQSRNEILKMSEGAAKMMEWLKTLINQDEQDVDLANRLRHRETVLDTVQDEVTQFVTNLLSRNVPHSVAEECRQQLRLADEYESISDYLDSLLSSDQRLRKDNLRLSKKQRKGLGELHDAVAEYVEIINQAYRDRNPSAFAKLEAPGKRIHERIKDLRREHLADLSTETFAPQLSVAFLGALTSYARVRDHAQNIGELVAGEK